MAGDELDDGLQGGQLAVGFALEEHWNLELALQRLTLEGKDTGADLDQTGLVVNLLNVYNRDGLFAPYLLAGIGFVNDDAGGAIGDEDNFQAQGGLGVFTNFSKRVSLRTGCVKSAGRVPFGHTSHCASNASASAVACACCARRSSLTSVNMLTVPPARLRTNRPCRERPSRSS